MNCAVSELLVDRMLEGSNVECSTTNHIQKKKYICMQIDRSTIHDLDAEYVVLVSQVG